MIKNKISEQRTATMTRFRSLPDWVNSGPRRMVVGSLGFASCPDEELS